MIAAGLDEVYRAISGCISDGNYRMAEQLTWPALDQFPNDPQLLFYACHLFTVQGKLVPAMLCAKRSHELEPTGANYTNMGALYRRMNYVEEAHACLVEAVGYDPKNKHNWNNLAAAQVNEGNPEPGLEAAREALRLDPRFSKARWNKGLLELEKGDFKAGFRDYRGGLVAGERLMRTYSPEDKKAEPTMLYRLGQLKAWRKRNPGKRPRVIVWGEQGLGDELMFSTCIPDLYQHADVFFDCHPRMVKIMERSHRPFIVGLHGGRKDKDVSWYQDIEPCQFKCSVGDLPRWFRTDYSDFRRAAAEYSPWFLTDPAETALYRKCLEELSPGKRYVGVAWTGGVISTQRWYRCVQLQEMKWLLNHPEIVPVSLQYEDDALHVSKYLEENSKLIYRFPGVTTHFDYDHHHNLIGALDAVVSICSTTAHLSAASGKPTFVLVPDKPAWRYGLRGTEWYWYGSNAALYRKGGDSWESAVDAMTRDVFAHLGLEDY